MQQSQIIGMSILSGGCGGKIVSIDFKKEGGQDQSLVDAFSQTSKLALLVITGDEGEASISNKLRDHRSNMPIRQKS